MNKNPKKINVLFSNSNGVSKGKELDSENEYNSDTCSGKLSYNTPPLKELLGCDDDDVKEIR